MDHRLMALLAACTLLSLILATQLRAAPPGASGAYLPVATWSGRLILPTPDQRSTDGGVWIQLENTPEEHAELTGRRAWLALRSAARARLSGAVGSVHFDRGTRRQQSKGNLAPERLDGWQSVSPLESLAGARAADDVRVALDEVSIQNDATSGARLEIGCMPTQISGTAVGLVKILALTPDGFSVQHFDRASAAFSGPRETLKITDAASPAIRRVLGSIPSSPLGRDGWYVRGALEATGFVVDSLEPVALHSVGEDSLRTSDDAVLGYLEHENWDRTPERMGQFWTLFGTSSERAPRTVPGQVGTRHLVIHSFGGLGGRGGDGNGLVNVVGGHMAYGYGRVVSDPFRRVPRIEITYNQIYGNNPEGIIAGRLAWHQYMGSLVSGWLYLRPVSDVLVGLPLLDRPIDVGDGKIRFLEEFMTRADTVAALYRIGFGGGAAIVTSHNNCSQDSARALFETVSMLRNVESPITSSGRVLDPELAALQGLSKDIWRFLVPSGEMPSAWSSGGGAPEGRGPRRPTTNLAGLFQSRHTVMPRHHADGITRLLFEHGAQLRYARTNALSQPGFEPYPLPPQLNFPVIVDVH